jgi:CHAT domain-containing protein/tetratricopeptide (TPR) repeat protein
MSLLVSMMTVIVLRLSSAISRQLGPFKTPARRLAILAVLSLCAGYPVHAQEQEWKRLDREVQYLYKQGDYDKAVVAAEEALRTAERTFSPDDAAVSKSLNNLAFLYKVKGRYAQAEPLYMRSLAIREKTLGLDHPHVATVLSNLGLLYEAKGQYVQAEPMFKRSLAIREKVLGQNDPEVGRVLGNLAGLYYAVGQYATAEPLYKRSLSILELSLGPDHPDVATCLESLALLYNAEGRYALAEPLQVRSLWIREKTFGPDHPDVAYSLNNLAELYMTQGQVSHAEPLFKRSLAIWEKAFGPDDSKVGLSINNLATLYNIQGQFALAEPLYKRSLAIMERVLGPDHPYVATSINNLALLYSKQGRYSQAEPLFKRSLEIVENAFGPDHPSVGLGLNNLAESYTASRQYEQAEPLYKHSLAIWEKALGADHPTVAGSLNNFGRLYAIEGRYEQALPLLRRASSILWKRIVAGGTGDSVVREANQNQYGFVAHLWLLSRNPYKESAEKIADESFQIVQLAQASGTASAIAKMASRFGSGDDALAGLIKRKQDASDRRIKAEGQLVSASSKPPKERRADAEQRLRDDIASAGKEIESIDAELTRRFPEYQELTRPEPASTKQIQALLKSGEAMLVYSIGEKSFLWVVKQDGAVFLPLEANVKDMAPNVAIIRSQMEFDAAGYPPRVSVGVLHELYQSIFAPALPHLAGIAHVMVVPSGPLQSLPFGMLVASPAKEISSDEDYRKVDWLAKRYAFSVLPSVGSIKALRQFAKAAATQEPFAGFGDPLIGKPGDTTRGKRAKVDVAVVFRSLTEKTNGKSNSSGGEIADVEAIRNASRLAETADELRAMGKTLKAGPNSIWLQNEATETRVKTLDLSKYRTIAFATHGAMAGDIGGVGEAGLILTPPLQGTTDDDGYLSASEVARLKLNADWVVLSACNTAAADGTPGAEGLSGLAKAFFYAGARSLLVSHWWVASDATVPLTTTMLKEYEANPAQGKAEAHRKAMMALMVTPDHPEYAHPIFWAPFVIVGEGGAMVPK